MADIFFISAHPHGRRAGHRAAPGAICPCCEDNSTRKARRLANKKGRQALKRDTVNRVREAEAGESGE